ncbi:MAG: hypothetical protein MUD01_06765 [Chloroflexaceae bacterium]|nr:hypothetical protein [Chloroflexaceae bacterium]
MPEARQPEPPTYTSFLVRFWYEPEEVRWYGEVEHIQSHTRIRVNDVHEVIHFLTAHSLATFDLLTQHPPPADDG